MGSVVAHRFLSLRELGSLDCKIEATPATIRN
jgi:hypothetical protein